MTETPPETADAVRARLRASSGAERFRMAGEALATDISAWPRY
jgi:hypothetical protein